MENIFIIDNPEKNRFKYWAKYLITVLDNVFYKIIVRKSNDFSEKKYKYSICSIFKNEAPYLKEFIEYHFLLGFQHFYFYNNNSDDDFKAVLNPYIENGIVTLIEWPVIPGQQAAYEHFYNNYRNETTWVSFLDLDEFICPQKCTNIEDWIKPYEKYPVILMYWRMFGTNGRLEHDSSKLVVEQYTNCWEKEYAIGKILYNTNYDIVDFFRAMMHGFKVNYRGVKLPPVNTYGYFVEHNIHLHGRKGNTIQVNHYWSKAYNTYIAKHKRGSAAFGKSWKTFDKFLWHENYNTSSDFTIYRFLIQLKLKIKGDYPQE